MRHFIFLLVYELDGGPHGPTIMRRTDEHTVKASNQFEAIRLMGERLEAWPEESRHQGRIVTIILLEEGRSP